MKWPCGPLEIERLRRDDNQNPKLQKLAERCADPLSLQVLKGSSINCLIVDWAAGSDVDQAHQTALGPLIQAGRTMGVSFVGRISAGKNLAEIVAAGRIAGLEAVLLEKLPGRELSLQFIVPYPNDETDWNTVTAIYRGTGATWPGAGLATTSGDQASGGPTNAPTVNSNGWFSLMSREIAPGKIPWLDVDPPTSAGIVPAEEYCRVIADSRAYGSYWMVALDTRMRQGLLDQEKRAMETWRQLTRTLAFFERNIGWEAYRPMGALAVVSDFVGLNALTSGELLSFLNRNQTQFLAMERQRMNTPTGIGVKGMVWMDDAEPTAAQHEQVLQFVQQGGVVIAAKYWGPTGVAPIQEDWMPEYRTYPVGSGRIVVANSGLLDSYLISRYAPLLIGRRNDFVRLFNPEMSNYCCSIHPNGKSQRVQLINYGNKPVEYMSLWVNAEARSAMLVVPESESRLPLECSFASGGTEIHIPKLAVNCVVEIERSAS